MTVTLQFLGGVGEFGRNCLLIDDDDWDAALVVDCGLKIVDVRHDGGRHQDLLLPELGPIAKQGSRLAGYVLTHGHDDHIGGLPRAAVINAAPLYGTPFTRRRVRRRFAKDGRSLPELMAVDVGAERKIGPFPVRFLAVSHSIPDSTAVVIKTSAGAIVHSGDWRVDETPIIGPPTDLAGLRAACAGGVRLLLADSTGAVTPGHNPGERSVEAGLDAAFKGVKGRLYIATFASHVQRIALVAELCRRHGRRLVVVGRGMRDSVHAAQELAMLGIDDVLLPERDVFSVPAHLQCAVVTGTQGEPGSALERIAHGGHARFEPRVGDRVVLSSRIIPGNEEEVGEIITALEAAGVDVWDGRDGRHVSGHGHREDLEQLVDTVRPDVFCPVHGEKRHLDACGGIASRMGVETVLQATNGDVIRLDSDACAVVPSSPGWGTPPAS